MFVPTQNTTTHTQGLQLTQDPAPPIDVGVADEFGGVKHTKNHRHNQEDCAHNVADLFDNDSLLWELDTNVPAQSDQKHRERRHGTEVCGSECV